MEKTQILKVLKIDENDVEEISQVFTENKQIVKIKLTRNFNKINHIDRNKIIAFGWKTRKVHTKILNEYKSIVYIKYPRFKNKITNQIISYSNVLSDYYKRMSRSLIKNVLKLLRKDTMTYKCAAELNDISTQEVLRIFDEYIECPRGKLSKIICIDECHNKDQFGEQKYCAILSDFISHNVLDVIKDRKLETLDEYFSNISLKERLNVEFVSMDMWKTYKIITRKFLPNAIISIDPFHVIYTIKRCIKDLEMSIYHKLEDGSKEKKLLKKYFNQIIDYKINHQKISFEIRKHCRKTTYEIKNDILAVDKMLCEAILFLDRYKELNRICSYKDFDEKFAQFIKDNPIYNEDCFSVIKTMFTDWYEEIKNSFQRIETSYQIKRICNALAESLNNIYKKIMRVSNGVKNFERFRKRFMYCINKLVNYYQPKKL